MHNETDIDDYGLTRAPQSYPGWDPSSLFGNQIDYSRVATPNVDPSVSKSNDSMDSPAAQPSNIETKGGSAAIVNEAVAASSHCDDRLPPEMLEAKGVTDDLGLPDAIRLVDAASTTAPLSEGAGVGCDGSGSMTCGDPAVAEPDDLDCHGLGEAAHLSLSTPDGEDAGEDADVDPSVSMSNDSIDLGEKMATDCGKNYIQSEGNDATPFDIAKIKTIQHVFMGSSRQNSSSMTNMPTEYHLHDLVNNAHGDREDIIHAAVAIQTIYRGYCARVLANRICLDLERSKFKDRNLKASTSMASHAVQCENLKCSIDEEPLVFKVVKNVSKKQKLSSGTEKISSIVIPSKMESLLLNNYNESGVKSLLKMSEHVIHQLELGSLECSAQSDDEIPAEEMLEDEDDFCVDDYILTPDLKTWKSRENILNMNSVGKSLNGITVHNQALVDELLLYDVSTQGTKCIIPDIRGETNPANRMIGAVIRTGGLGGLSVPTRPTSPGHDKAVSNIVSVVALRRVLEDMGDGEIEIRPKKSPRSVESNGIPRNHQNSPCTAVANQIEWYKEAGGTEIISRSVVHIQRIVRGHLHRILSARLHAERKKKKDPRSNVCPECKRNFNRGNKCKACGRKKVVSRPIISLPIQANENSVASKNKKRSKVEQIPRRVDNQDDSDVEALEKRLEIELKGLQMLMDRYSHDDIPSAKVVPKTQVKIGRDSNNIKTEKPADKNFKDEPTRVPTNRKKGGERKVVDLPDQIASQKCLEPHQRHSSLIDRKIIETKPSQDTNIVMVKNVVDMDVIPSKEVRLGAQKVTALESRKESKVIKIAKKADSLLLPPLPADLVHLRNPGHIDFKKVENNSTDNADEGDISLPCINEGNFEKLDGGQLFQHPMSSVRHKKKSSERRDRKESTMSAPPRMSLGPKINSAVPNSIQLHGDYNQKKK